MNDGTSTGGTATRSPFAAYGPASAGYGLRPSVAPPVLGPPGTPVRPAGPPDGREPPRPPAGRRGAVGVIALILACIGAALSLIPFGGFLSWMPLLAAVVLAIVQLARRGAPRAAAASALIVAVIGVVAVVAWSIALSGFGTASAPSDRYSSPPLATADPPVPDDGDLVAPDADAEPLPWGSPTRILDGDGADVWTVAVKAPQDITAQAGELDAAPTTGSVVAVPVEITNITAGPIALSSWQGTFTSDLRLANGDWPQRLYVDGLSDVYPERFRLDVVEPGQSITYYDVWDAPFADIAGGTAQFFLYDAGTTVEWGGPLP